MATIYDFKALDNKGEEMDMAQYRSNVIKRFPPAATPEERDADIELMLK